jgi:hypothetical protein
LLAVSPAKVRKVAQLHLTPRSWVEAIEGLGESVGVVVAADIETERAAVAE